MTWSLQLSVAAPSKVRNIGMDIFCQPFGRTDHMRQATLP